MHDPGGKEKVLKGTTKSKYGTKLPSSGETKLIQNLQVPPDLSHSQISWDGSGSECFGSNTGFGPFWSTPIFLIFSPGMVCCLA